MEIQITIRKVGGFEMYECFDENQNIISFGYGIPEAINDYLNRYSERYNVEIEDIKYKWS